MKAGDWTCPRCGDHAFASRNNCRQCGASKPGTTAVPAPTSAHGRPGDWTCPGCSGLVFASKSYCGKCGTTKTAASGLTAPAVGVVASGGRPGDWICPGCSGLVFASKSACGKCSTPKPTISGCSDWTCPSCGDWQFARNSHCRKCGTAQNQGDSTTNASAPKGASVPSGDWTCPSCGDWQFARNTNCRVCNTARPEPGAATVVVAAASTKPTGDWTCPSCGDWQFARNTNCRACNTPRPEPGAAASTTPTGDWTCPSCGDWQFARNTNCRKCSTLRPEPGVAAVAAAAASTMPTGDWTCPSCGDHVFARSSNCRKCNTPRPEPAAAAVAAATSAAASVAVGTSGASRAGDWQCPTCQDLQFARNETCRKCGTARPRWLGADLSLKPPSYWTTVQSGVWSAVPVGAEEMSAFETGFAMGGTLGGKDQKTALDYKGFTPYCAWRLQHPGLWGKYAMERENLSKIELPALRADGVRLPDPRLRQPFKDMATMLPGSLDTSINEVYLSHGSRPESLLAIISGGLNERFSGGLFGNGTYFAEDIGKNDQYCTYDEKHGDHPELHKLLFDSPGLVHPDKLLYVLVCRVMLGVLIRTKDGHTELEGDRRSIWSSKSRELTTIHNASTPLLHHSLLVEVGGKIARYREFIVFHGDRIYPEYLIAYQRTK